MYIVYVHNATMGRVFFFFRGVKEFSFIVLSSPIHPVRPTDSHPPAYKRCRPKLCGIIIYCDGTLLALLFFYSFFFFLNCWKDGKEKVDAGFRWVDQEGFGCPPFFFYKCIYLKSRFFSGSYVLGQIGWTGYASGLWGFWLLLLLLVPFFQPGGFTRQ